MKHDPVNRLPKVISKKTDKKIQKKNSNHNKLCNLKIACILDEISYECFKFECDLIPIGVNDWKDKLISAKPSLLLVESAWQGNNGMWKGRITNINKKLDRTLQKLVYWCKNNNIPTVFWNKEDPGHFKKFIYAAKLFDYVFTTDSNSVSKYIEVLGHNKVYALPFAAQPRIHNPIDKDKNKVGKIAFAGTWHNSGHSVRKDNAEIVLKPALQYDLQIYDRASNINNDLYKFPNEYTPYIKNSISYKNIVEIYKKYDVFLNINSINDSPTMFSRRIFELLACGANVVSSYSIGIEKFFPDIVKLCKSEEDTIKHLDILLNDKDLRDRISVIGLRKVLRKHTYKHRLEAILNKIGIKYKNDDEPGVSIICSTNRQHFMDNVFENFIRQNYTAKELIIILNKNNIDSSSWVERAKAHKNISVFSIDETEPLGACLNLGIKKSNFNYVAKFDDDDYYGPEYLRDSMMAFQYTDADIVGKLTNYVYFTEDKLLAIQHKNREHQYVKYVNGGTLLCKKNVFNKIKFTTDYKVGCDTVFLQDCNINGFKIYSIDRFNYIVGRRANIEDHTWKVSQKEFLKKCEIIEYTDKHREFVTV
jgi:spore maturation protein CgeB